ncbi:MAG: hypothetical protein HY737_00770 [Candidatus Omnitrophica bacterium]|nr:hypothetical protein [Candidatus Omnitrophota bacterium]
MKPKGSEGARVLLIGCGELGSRHLQAIASLPQVTDIDVVDPRPEALALGRKRLGELAPGNPSTSIRWLSSLAEATPAGALCIVATQAEGRCELIRQVAQTLGYTNFLLEKIVAQSLRAIEELVDFLSTRRCAAWVNCQTRAYPFHQRVKQRLEASSPIMMTVTGGNLGLVTNGIHNADLFAFYTGATCIEPAGASIDPVLHRTKRGQYDLSGTLQGRTEDGSRFTLAYAADHALSEQITIVTRSYRCVVDHIQRWAVESDAASRWSWRSVPFEDQIMVSQMTQRFAADILAQRRCALPTLEESLVAHRLILGELQPHFSRLLERDLELVPVT